MPTPSRAVLWGVLLTAMATLLFEVAITRVFAVTMWYHFGFLAISLALVGVTASAVCCFLWQQALTGTRRRGHMAGSAAVFALLVPAAVYLHLNAGMDRFNITGEKFYLVLSLQVLLFFACFFAAGLCISIALSSYAGSFGKLYCFDLLGAALGALLLVPLLYHVSPLAVCFLASALALLAALLFQTQRRSRAWLAAGLTAALALFAVNDSWGVLHIAHVKSHAWNRIQQRETPPLLVKWSPLGRIAVLPTGDPDKLRVTNDGAAPTMLYQFDGDLSKFAYLKQDLREIVHQVKSDARTLIIGSAGGKDVLAALVADQPHVTAVEINPVTGELVRETYADYTGALFHHPRVKFHTAEGRNFVARSRKAYDVIQISMIDSWQGAAGGYIFNENSLYTREAISGYLNHLQPGGVLSITRYYKHDEALRLANIMLAALEAQGIENPARRLMVVAGGGHVKRATLLLKRGDFTAEEAQACLAAASRGGHHLVYAPGVPPESLLEDDYARGFQSLIAASGRSPEARRRWVAGFPKNITVSTDNQPFFFFTLRTADVFQPDRSAHGARRMALPLLYGSLAALLVISLASIVAPLLLARGARLDGAPCRLRVLLFCACLGAGFMLVEMALIHRLTVFLGYPTYALIVVLTTLLCAGGLGSLFTARGAAMFAPRRLPLVLGAAATVLTLLGLMLLDSLNEMMWLPDAARIALAVAMTAVPGFLMGMCFPLGMQIAGALHPRLIPWSWGVNGAFSVLGSSLALVLAIDFGLKAVLLTGALCYAIAAATALWFKREATQRMEIARLSDADDTLNAMPRENSPAQQLQAPARTTPRDSSLEPVDHSPA